MSGLLRAASVIALATLASRVLGLGREVVIAHEFGASAAYDAFIIAFLIPHLLRKLLAEGALSTAFIPIYSSLRTTDPDRASRFAGNVGTVALVGFPIIVIAGIWGAPALVSLLADGFDPAKQALAAELTRWTFPFIMLVGLAALVMGVLNSHDHFFAPAFAPVLFNIGLIVGAVVIAPNVDPPVMGLAWGVLLGGFGMLVFQLPFVRSFLDFRPRFRLDDEDLKRLVVLMGPTVLGLIVVELNVLVDNKLASRLADGSIASLQYAVRLFQLPLGVFAVAVATALLPRLSRLAEPSSRERFVETLQDGLRLATLVLLPATVGLIVLGGPIVGLLFEHGAFSVDDSTRTLGVLRYLSLGILGYGMTYLVTRAFYALQDTKTPMVISSVAVAVNIALDLLLVGPMGVDGLALATAAAGTVQLLLSLVILSRRLESPLTRAVAGDGAKIALTAALMGATVYGVDGALLSSNLGDAVRTGAGLLVGLVSYGGLALLMPSMRETLQASGLKIRDAWP